MARWFFLTEKDRAERAKDKEVKRETKFYLENFPDWLANSGIAHWTTSKESQFVLRHKVQFLKGSFNHDAIYLQVDMRHLPFPHNAAELHTPEILETLSGCAGRQVGWECTSPENGAFYVIARDGAIGAVPVSFSFDNALALLPESMPPLEFVVGASRNRGAQHVDIAQMPHYLIGGATYTGKSVHINAMLCQLLERNTPATLRLVLIDLKGTEFNHYEGIPHLWCPIVTKVDDVVPTLKRFEEEIHARASRFARAKVKDMLGWNHNHPHEQLPYILVVIDELAEVLKSYDKDMSKDAELVIGRTISLSRSSGGHYVLSTQRPSTDVIPAWVKSNASVRVAFAMAGQHDSMVVIDCGDAKGLKPAGRAIFQRGPDRIEVQSPFISDAQIAKVVHRAIAGQGDTSEQPDREIGLQDLLDEAIDNYGGALKERELYNSFRGKLGRNQIRRLLKTLNGDPVTVHGKLYMVNHKKRGIITTPVLEECQRHIEPLPHLSRKISHDLIPRQRLRQENPEKRGD